MLNSFKIFLFAAVLISIGSSQAFAKHSKHRKRRKPQAPLIEAHVRPRETPPKTWDIRPMPELLPIAQIPQSIMAAQDTQVLSIPKGQNWMNILQKNHFSKKEVGQLISSRAIPTKTHIGPFSRYMVNHFKDGRIEVKFYLRYNDEALVFIKNDKAIDVQRVVVDFRRETKAVSGVIDGGLSNSIRKQVNSALVVDQLEDAFSFDFDLKQKIKKDDPFFMLVEEKYDQDHFVDFGDVREIRITLNGEENVRYLEEDQGNKFYINPDADYSLRGFYAPIGKVHISSPFVARRLHPIRRRYQSHYGTDFANLENTPILAAQEGEIREVGFRKANGNFISIEHPNGFVTFYNHMARVAAHVKQGMKVAAGEVIGFMGATGFATGVHLHFTIRKGETVYNPVFLMRPYPATAEKAVNEFLGKLDEEDK